MLTDRFKEKAKTVTPKKEKVAAGRVSKSVIQTPTKANKRAVNTDIVSIDLCSTDDTQASSNELESSFSGLIDAPGEEFDIKGEGPEFEGNLMEFDPAMYGGMEYDQLI